VLCGCVFLFHLANAALLSLAVQEISRRTRARPSLYVMSASLVITQLVTIGIGLALGRFAQNLPRKPIFLVAFLVLPVRALLYLVTDHPTALVTLQCLDGIGAGVFGVMQILTVSDLTRGSGHSERGLTADNLSF
jgi:MFS family permease